MTATATQTAPVPGAVPRGGVPIDDWRPEDPTFWEHTGRRVARRNLAWSIFSEHLGFSVWMLWSVSAALLVKSGFDFSTAQLFALVAVPNLVGALIRLPYTFAVPVFGGRTWTMVSAALLLVPTLLFALVAQRPGTPYWVFLLVAATAGLGGGNFASSMSNINFFYPAAKKGTALGLNAAGGNVGVSVIQFFGPVVVGSAGVFGLVQTADVLHLERAGYLYAVLAVVATFAAWRFMNNLSVSRAPAAKTLAVARRKQTWIVSLLYIGTFGSFIGYSAAMPLLIKLNFWVPTPEPAGTGIQFAYYAFLGALVGSFARPLGGWLADRYGGAKITLASFALMLVGTLAILASLRALTPNPHQDAGIATANESLFGWFLAAFLLVFFATGIGNGSTYRMIPLIWRSEATRGLAEGTPEHDRAVTASTREASAALGVVGAVGALGGFGIPLMFGAPWVTEPMQATRTAFALFAGYYLLCAGITWFVYLRSTFLVGRVPSLAEARV